MYLTDPVETCQSPLPPSLEVYIITSSSPRFTTTQTDTPRVVQIREQKLQEVWISIIDINNSKIDLPL